MMVRKVSLWLNRIARPQLAKMGMVMALVFVQVMELALEILIEKGKEIEVPDQNIYLAVSPLCLQKR